MSEFANIMDQLKAGVSKPYESQVAAETKKQEKAEKRAAKPSKAPKPFEALEQSARERSKQRISVDLPAELVGAFRDICQQRGFIQREALQAAITNFVNHFEG